MKWLNYHNIRLEWELVGDYLRRTTEEKNAQLDRVQLEQVIKEKLDQFIHTCEEEWLIVAVNDLEDWNKLLISM